MELRTDLREERWGLDMSSVLRAGSVRLLDWREAVATTTTFVLAAYLRGDEPLGEYEARLRELRKLYTPSDGSSDSA